MTSDRLPKQLMFGELLKKRPFYGAKKRWRDEVMTDLQAISRDPPIMLIILPIMLCCTA